MNRINEIDNTIEGKEIKTYDQDHPELVVLSGRLYGKVTYVEYFDAYYLQFGDNVYYFPQKDSYQEGKNWKKKKFESYEECLNFSQQHNIKIVMKSTVKSPFSNGLPDTRFLFPKRNTPYDPSERADVSRIRENKHNTNMNKNLIRLTENDLHNIVKEAVNKILTESSIDDVFDGMPHTYTVDLYTKSEGKFGYAFSNIRNYDELNAAIKERFPDVLNWKNPRRNKPFNGWH